jgi:tetratricopeptide (TPR) repeat protein
LPLLPFSKKKTKKTSLPKPNLARMIRDPRLFRRRLWIGCALLVVASGIGVFIYTANRSAGEQELYRTAEAYWQQGKYSDAARYYERLISRYPKGALREKVLWDAAVTQYLYLRNIHRAIEIYGIILKESSNGELRIAARRNLSEIYLRDVGDLSLALEESKALCEEVRTPSDHQKAELELAEVYFKMNDFSKAMECYARVAASTEDMHLVAKANLRIGGIRQLGHDYQAAIPAYEAVLKGTKCAECLHQARMGLLDSYESLERFEDAIKVLKTLEGGEQVEAFKASEGRRIEEKRGVLRAESAVNWSNKRGQQAKQKN